MVVTNNFNGAISESLDKPVEFSLSSMEAADMKNKKWDQKADS